MIREGNEELASTDRHQHRQYFEELRRLILDLRTRRVSENSASHQHVPRATSPMDVEIPPPHQSVPSGGVDVVPQRVEHRQPITDRSDSASRLSLGSSSHSDELDARRNQGDMAPVAESRAKKGPASARTARALPQLNQSADDLPALPAEEEAVAPAAVHRAKRGSTSARTAQAVPQLGQSPDDLPALPAEEVAPVA